jgi:CheY-like chemotaxis protein
MVDVAAEVPGTLEADGGRIRQVLLNLLSNAIKFTQQGQIHIKISVVEKNSDGLMVRCAVIDRGIGIAPEAQSRLFQPISQADSSTTRKYGGTGLGLAICKQLVELMGGAMGVHSDEGKGSEFWFTFFSPWIEARKQAPVAVAPAASAAGKLPQRILLVDDNPVNQMVALRLLKLIGLDADVAADGVEAVAAARRQEYDLILMDCEMPNLDGYGATAEIRQSEASGQHRARIIAMTANAMAGDRDKCLDAGMDDYLAKPIQLETLRATLERCQ